MSDAPSERTQVHRLPDRARYDRDTIERILDEALICHVAWTDDEGRARVLPTIQARVGETLYLHGSRGARVEGGRRGRGGVRRGHDRRCARPGAERLPSLDELQERGAL